VAYLNFEKSLYEKLQNGLKPPVSIKELEFLMQNQKIEENALILVKMLLDKHMEDLRERGGAKFIRALKLELRFWKTLTRSQFSSVQCDTLIYHGMIENRRPTK
jgi:hypothetical protein